MSILTNPNNLNQNIEVIFDTNNKTIELLIDGNLTSDGVDFYTLYLFTESEWNNDPNLSLFQFPFKFIDEQKFELINGWTFINSNTIDLLRNAGFSIKNGSNVSLEEYACIITFGDINTDSQIYYTQGNTQDWTNFNTNGHVNQCIKIYDFLNSINYKNNIKLFVRDYYNTYDQIELSDIGVDEMTYDTYRFPLNTENDLNVVNDTVTVDTYGVTITYYDNDIMKTIDDNSYPFNIVIDGNGRRIGEIYQAVKSLLLKEYDIDNGTGTVIGKVSDELIYYEGEILTTKQGVFIENISKVDINSVEFYDSNNILRTYLYVSSGKIIFNENLYNDGNAEYMMFFKDTWGGDNAIPVKNENGVEIRDVINNSENEFTFGYDTDSDGGLPSTDKNVTIIAIGKNKGEFIKVDGTISRTKNNIFRINAPKEINYKI
jgi:hypothetical protein